MVSDAQVRLLRQKRMEDKTQEAAAAAAGMSVRTARTWARGALPSAGTTPRSWRTRPDPFAEVWEPEIVPLLAVDKAGVLEATTVLDVLAERHGARIVLFGERSDQPICRELAGSMRRPPLDISGTTTLAQFIHLMARCRLIVCNDGGPLHIAASLGVRTVSVFGPVDPRVYGPYPPGSRHRVVVKDLGCRPCYQHFKLPPCPYQRACLETLEAAPVVVAAEASLQEALSATAQAQAPA